MIDTIMLATKNPDKVKEIIKILPPNIKIKTFNDFKNLPDVIEDGLTIEENSQKKAIEIARFTSLVSIADDTGLFVEALNFRPGVYSSRYAGENATYEDNCKKLLEEMKGFKGRDRRAFFRCAITIAFPDKRFVTCVGEIEGIIALKPRGKNGFGYDPLFYVPSYHMTFAEMPLELKNKISHRGKAVEMIKPIIDKIVKYGSF
jgi:XTP/dITP diphosphohydrolase